MEQKYDFTQAEPMMQQLWREEEIYKYKNDPKRKTYSIDTPPPTVSGNLHIGHVFSFTQAEIIARYHRMQGENVYYPFGFDDNGLPTERLVEKELGIRAKDMKRSEFAKHCKEITDEYESEFKEMWEMLGFSVDWNLKYKTINDKSMRISQRSFLELARKGKAYLKESPVLWCTTCQTSIAQAELETTELESYFNYLKFQVGEESLIVATTRPELLYGCVCLFVNPKDERYLQFVGKKAIVPYYHFEIPILTDEEVSLTKGTGVVMCATYGDATDVMWCEKYQLPYKAVIDENGRILPQVPELGSLKIIEARKKIISLCEETGELINQEPITHTVAVHERCGKEIEILPSKQWYIDVLSDREKYLEAGDQINWYPSYMKKRYQMWVENLKWDWCISRQRYFGVPFPVWYCKKCNRPIFAEDSQLPVNPLETKPLRPCSCGCNEFIPERAVFDTWATSSVTPLIHANYKEEDMREEFLPMTLRTQAHDIIRTWAFYTIVKSIYHTGKLPWKDLMVCGFVLAKKGEKISKHKNNEKSSPKALIKQHSADALRYWTSSANLGTDTFFSEEDLKVSKRFLTKLWNAAKFSIYHLKDFSMEDKTYYERKYQECISSDGNVNDFMPYDLSLLCKMAEVITKAKQFLEHYEIGQARKIIDDFFWKDYCDYYIEIVKERLYQPDKHGESQRKSAQYTIYRTLLSMLKLYAIYVPHITDYIYQQYYREFEKVCSIHQTIWERVDTTKERGSWIQFGNQINEIISQVRKYKTEHNLSMKDALISITITCHQEDAKYLSKTLLDLRACTNTQDIRIKPSENEALIVEICY